MSLNRTGKIQNDKGIVSAYSVEHQTRKILTFGTISGSGRISDSKISSYLKLEKMTDF